MSRMVSARRCLRSGVAAALGLAVGLGLGAEAWAQCQASGGIDLDPAQTNLETGDIFDVEISVLNGSSVLPFPPPFVNGVLTGTTVVQLACTSSTCAATLPNTLQFIPVGATGCVSQAAGVSMCQFGAGDPDNDVEIVMTAGGVALPANAFTSIATIRVQAETPVNTATGEFFMRGETGANDIATADPFNCAVPATGFGFGSVNLFYPPQCEVLVDKQIDCGAGFIDVGFSDGVAEFCQAGLGATVAVRYIARNDGDVAVFGCEITESNPGIEPAPIPVGLILPGDEVQLPDDIDQQCSAQLAAGEPDTATLECDCDAPFAGETRMDEDSADFDCDTGMKMGCWPVMP